MPGYIGGARSVVSSGAERKQTYAITTTTSTLTGLAYTPTKVHVFHNGIRLVDGTDYTATNGTSITLTNAAQDGDEIVVISNAGFQVSDTVSASNGGTFAGNVSMSANLDVGGTLGVGIDTPDTALHVAGGANPTLQLTAYEGTQNCDVQIMPIRAEFTGSKSVMSLRTHNGTSMAEGLRINEDGHVTQPKIPHFHAVGAGVGGGSTYFSNRYLGDNIRRNNGNHYSTASNANKFTAPVAGVYAFSGGCLKYGTGTVNLQLRINGSPGHATDYAEAASGYQNCTISAQVYLNANDYVQLFAANGNWYDNGPGSSDYNWFSGCLIG